MVPDGDVMLSPIANYDQLTGWRAAFLVLATNRCQSLWPRAGVPTSMCEQPATLARSARRFFGRDAAYYHNRPRITVDALRLRSGGVPEDRALSTESLLKDSMRIVSGAYGDRDTALLVAWATRHFVDAAQRQSLENWGYIIGRLASNENGSLSTMSTTVSVDAAGAVAMVHAEMLNEELLQRDYLAVEAVRGRKLGEWERRMVKPSVDAIDGFEEPDRDILFMFGAVGNERFYRALIALNSRINSVDRARLLAWIPSLTVGKDGFDTVLGTLAPALPLGFWLTDPHSN
jgi:hypothetical protein